MTGTRNSLPVRLLSRLVGRNEAHSSKNDEMRAETRLAALAQVADAIDRVEAGEPTLGLAALYAAHRILATDDPRADASPLTGSLGVVQKGERT